MKITFNKNNPHEFINNIKSVTKNKNVLFACVGTDRSTGDSLGPIVGSSLELLGYNVVGTLDDPLHASNIVERMEILKQMNYDLVIAVDACLGKIDNISNIYLNYSSLKPGTGVGKELPEIGDYCITGVVNISGFMEYMVLQNTRLSIVMNMAKIIVEMIKIAIPLEENIIEVIRNGKENSMTLFEKAKSMFIPRKIKLA